MPDPGENNPFHDQPHEDRSSIPGGPAIPVGESQRQLALVKNGHRYVFHYSAGQESELLERLSSMARDPACKLEMFDAAVLSHQVGQRLGQQIDQIINH